MKFKIINKDNKYYLFNPALMNQSISVSTKLLLFRTLKNIAIKYNELFNSLENVEYFKTEEEAQKAIEWSEALMVCRKLENG